MNVFFFEDNRGRYLGYAACMDFKSYSGPVMVGGYLPKVEGNYYSQIITVFNQPKYDGGFYSWDDDENTVTDMNWYNWVKEGIKSGEIKMDEDYPFDFDSMRIARFELMDGGRDCGQL